MNHCNPLAPWRALLGAALVALVAACGGGGGGTAPLPTPQAGGGGGGSAGTPPPPSNSQYALQTNVPAPTYPAGTPRALILAKLNEVRAAGGWGLLGQSAALDQAANAHAQYVLTNRQLTHVQTAGLPGFTGVNPSDRAAAAGYTGVVTEVIGGFVASASAADFIPGVLRTIYHAQALQAGYRDVGIGVVLDTQFNQYIVVVLSGVATGASQQLMAAGGVKVYPGVGQTNVLTAFNPATEVPRPLPELTLAGHPVSVLLDNVNEAQLAASSLTVESFTLKDGSGNLVPALLMTAPGVKVGPGLTGDQRTDAMLAARSLYLVPKSPLLANTTYTAQVSARTSAGTYDRTWSFTTGNFTSSQ